MPDTAPDTARLPADAKPKTPVKRLFAHMSAEELRRPVTYRGIQTYLEQMIDMLVEHEVANRKEFASIISRLATLERRFEDIADRGVKLSGVYQRAQSYAPGEMVTFGGSTFGALRRIAPNEAPEECNGWQLVAKRGRDGKDLRDV